MTPTSRKSLYRPLLLMLPAAQAVLVCGCTSALWDKETFARRYRPASPANLHLYYSPERKDVLVQYDEISEVDHETHPRCYWLDPNTSRVNKAKKPRFVPATATVGLIPIAISESNSPTPRLEELRAIARHYDDSFTLCLGQERLDPCKLPSYSSSSQKIKQVLLTPFAIGVDATIVGGVIAYYSAPSFFAGLNH